MARVPEGYYRHPDRDPEAKTISLRKTEVRVTCKGKQNIPDEFSIPQSRYRVYRLRENAPKETHIFGERHHESQGDATFAI